MVAEVDGLDRVSPDGVACVRESRSPGPELLLVQAYGNTSVVWLHRVPGLANRLDSAFLDLFILTAAVPTVQVTPRLVGDDGIRAARLPVIRELRDTDRELLDVTVVEHMHVAIPVRSRGTFELMGWKTSYQALTDRFFGLFLLLGGG